MSGRGAAIQQAVLARAETSRVEAVGARASAAAVARARASAISALTRRDPGLVRVGAAIESLVPTMARVMAVTHAAGLRRARLNARPHVRQLRSMALDKKTKPSELFEEVEEFFGKAVDVDLDALYELYEVRALDTVTGLGDYADKAVRQAVERLILEGDPVPQAVAALGKTLDGLGLGEAPGGRLETIYRTETQLAYNAGRWQELQDDAVQEILWGFMYVSVGDDRVREDHAALDGTTLPKDDPFWDTYWPPNGWNCRCAVIELFDERDEVQPEYLPDPEPGFGFNPGKLFAQDLPKVNKEGDDGVALAAPASMGWVGLTLPPDLARRVLRLGRRVDDADLHEKGREAEPHVTVRYGLWDADADDVKRALGHRLEASVRLGKTTVFQTPAFDVLKVDVQSLDLQRMHQALGRLPHTDTHDRYIPHVTVAYLTPGRGRKYVGIDTLSGVQVVLDDLTWSSGAGGQVSLALDKPLAFEWDPDAHPRDADGKFTSGGGGMPTKIGDLKLLKQLGGTTGARLMVDQSGKKWVVKAGKTPGHALNEHAANEAYRALGVKVGRTTMIGDEVAREYIEGTPLNQLSGKAYDDAVGQLRANFVADAYLGNWDVIGTGEDNVIVDADGVAWRSDNGGALDYRAQGGPKGGKWNGNASELDTMRGIGAHNPYAAKVFGSLTEGDLEKQFSGLQASGKLQAARTKIADALHGTGKVLGPTLAAREKSMEKRFSEVGKAEASTKAAIAENAAKSDEPAPASKGGATTGKSFLGTTHQEKVETLKGIIGETKGASKNLIDQVAIINSGKNDSHLVLSWYATDEVNNALKEAYPDKVAKTVEPSKVIKKQYAMTTKELAAKLEDGSFGVASLAKAAPTSLTTKGGGKVAYSPKPSYGGAKEPPGGWPPKTESGGGALYQKHAGAREVLSAGGTMQAKVSPIGPVDSAQLGELKNALPIAERAAIGSWQGSAAPMRQLMQTQNAGGKLDSSELKQISTFESALSKMPKYEGVTYRGAKHLKPGSEYYEALTKVGSEVEFATAACASRGVGTAASFRGGGDAVLLRMTATSGRMIEGNKTHTFNGEREVVIPRGTNFRVVGVTPGVLMPNGVRASAVVDLEEIAPTGKAVAKAFSMPPSLSLSADEADRDEQFQEDARDGCMTVRWSLEMLDRLV